MSTSVQPNPTKQMGKPEKGNRLRGFGALRILAAVHFMTFHVSAMKLEHNFFRWGGAWNPLLFALSGFMITRSQLERSDSADVGPLWPWMRQRLRRVYPLYIVSLVALLPFVLSMSPFYIISLPVHALLLQSWFAGQPTHIHLQWNGNAWFVSNLVVHWFCWWLTYPRLHGLSVQGCWCCMAAVAACALVRMRAVAGYYADGNYHNVQFVYANPVMNIHLFFSGAILAQLFRARLAASPARLDCLALPLGRRRVSVGASAALAALLLLFWLAEVPVDEGYHPVRSYAPCGILLPLQLMLIWGLACGEDPLAWLWQRWHFAWADAVYFEFYMLQYLCLLQGQRFLAASMTRLDRWQVSHTAAFFTLVLPASLGLSWLSHRYVNEPIQRCLARGRAARAGTPKQS